ADTSNNRIRRVGANGIITTIAGNGLGSSTGDGGPATAAGLQGPQGVASDSVGNIYISSAQSLIRKVSPDGTITTYAGGVYGYGGDDGPATGASLAFPRGLAVDATGNLYIADQNNDRVRKVSPR